MFTNSLEVREGKPGKWVLLKPLKYIDSEFRKWVVPEGFQTDLASIPLMFRSVFDVNGESRKAAVLHDWLYAAQVTTRLLADNLFLQALKDCKVGWWTRVMMYTAVRIGGWVCWYGYHKK